jgi:predicted methyltransferase
MTTFVVPAARSLALCCALLCATFSSISNAADASFADIIANPIRTEQDRRMDASRHPQEFLAFTGVKPGMKVLDVSAGAGYTSQVLALAVGPGGTVYAQSPKPGANLMKRVEDHPQANLVVVTRPFDDPVPPDAPKLDLVTLVNNYHDISYLPVDRKAMNAKIFAALKPGGRYVVMDHSAKPGTGITAGKTLHRIDEQFVRDEVIQAGFKLDGSGDFLRNREDTREESSGDGKIATDKFVLRFVKP